MTGNSKTTSPSDLKLEGITPKVSQPQDESHDKDKLVETQQERRKLQHKILKGSEKPLKSGYGINFVISIKYYFVNFLRRF